MTSSDRPRETAPAGGLLGGFYIDGVRVEGPGITPPPVSEGELDHA